MYITVHPDPNIPNSDWLHTTKKQIAIIYQPLHMPMNEQHGPSPNPNAVKNAAKTS